MLAFFDITFERNNQIQVLIINIQAGLDTYRTPSLHVFHCAPLNYSFWFSQCVIIAIRRLPPEFCKIS